MTLVKQAEYAAQHGVSRKTVTKWKQAGHLVFDGDLVNAAASDARLRGAGLGRFAEGRQGVTVTSSLLPSGNERGGPGNADRRASMADEDVTPEGPNGKSLEEFLRDILEGRFAVKADAEAAKENALAAIRLLELQEKDGALIPLDRAEMVFFEQARAFRDAMMNWPTDIGPLLAADLNLPADKVTEAMTRHVHTFLDRLGEPSADFRGEG